MTIHSYFIDPEGRTPDAFFHDICKMPTVWEHETRLVQHTGDGYFEISGQIAGLTEVPRRDPPLIPDDAV